MGNMYKNGNTGELENSLNLQFPQVPITMYKTLHEFHWKKAGEYGTKGICRESVINS